MFCGFHLVFVSSYLYLCRPSCICVVHLVFVSSILLCLATFGVFYPVFYIRIEIFASVIILRKVFYFFFHCLLFVKLYYYFIIATPFIRNHLRLSCYLFNCLLVFCISILSYWSLSRCCYEGCGFTTPSRRDLAQHRREERHSKLSRYSYT